MSSSPLASATSARRTWRICRSAGADGSLALLAKIKAPQRYYIHINNTNPILREDSAEHAAVEAAGWRVAYDGLEFEL